MSDPLGPPGKPTVLLVEDETMLLDVLRQMFEECDFTVLLAASGEDAVAKMENAVQIDLLVTDIRLPGGLGGWEVAERARELRPTLPVIYTTAYSQEMPRRVEGGVLMVKPYRPSTVMKVVQDLGFEGRSKSAKARALAQLAQVIQNAGSEMPSSQ
jgi:CheY-like chemotaxis protein